jgi:hypothetical protein
VQKRCLVPAKLGYVVFSPVQNHYEAIYWWMEKWLRNNRVDTLPAEPAVQAIPIEKL